MAQKTRHPGAAYSVMPEPVTPTQLFPCNPTPAVTVPSALTLPLFTMYEEEDSQDPHIKDQRSQVSHTRQAP